MLAGILSLLVILSVLLWSLAENGIIVTSTETHSILQKSTCLLKPLPRFCFFYICPQWPQMEFRKWPLDMELCWEGEWKAPLPASRLNCKEHTWPHSCGFSPSCWLPVPLPTVPAGDYMRWRVGRGLHQSGRGICSPDFGGKNMLSSGWTAGAEYPRVSKPGWKVIKSQEKVKNNSNSWTNFFFCFILNHRRLFSPECYSWSHFCHSTYCSSLIHLNTLSAAIISSREGIVFCLGPLNSAWHLACDCGRQKCPSEWSSEM